MVAYLQAAGANADNMAVTSRRRRTGEVRRRPDMRVNYTGTVLRCCCGAGSSVAVGVPASWVFPVRVP